MRSESGVTGSIIDELHSLDIPRGQMEGESGFARGIIHERHSSYLESEKMEGESCVTRASLMNFILCISNEIK